MLHGEPHPGNLLRTRKGPLFADLETLPRAGRVRYRPRPRGSGEHYPGADPGLIRQCRILMWALITTWRWCHDDQLPNRDYWRMEGLSQLRAALDRHPLDAA